MLEEINAALETYGVKWQKLVAGSVNKDFFAELQPTALGWKVADQTAYDQAFAELYPLCDQLHVAWLNERWLASLHLKDTVLHSGITTVKIMQVRPGSTDALGLDHVDFYGANISKQLLEQETAIKWFEENNGEACQWLSVWFEGTEAKLRTDTVFDVCAKELTQLSSEITDSKK